MLINTVLWLFLLGWVVISSWRCLLTSQSDDIFWPYDRLAKTVKKLYSQGHDLKTDTYTYEDDVRHFEGLFRGVFVNHHGFEVLQYKQSAIRLLQRTY